MIRNRRLVLSIVAPILALAVLAIVATASAERNAEGRPVPTASSSGFPLRFEPAGPDAGAFSANALGGKITIDGTAAAFRGPGGVEWELSFADATAGAVPAGDEPSRGPTHVARGVDPGAFAAVRGVALFPGVDLVASGTTDRLTMRAEIAAGEDPSRVAFRIGGASAALDAGGVVRWTTASGEFAFWVTQAWQESDGERRSLAASLAMTDDGRVVAQLSERDPDAPASLELSVWASRVTPLPARVSGPRIILDAAGAAYVAGTVPSRVGTPGAPGDGFVAKLDRSGRDFEWMTYLDDAGSVTPTAIALDHMGRIVVAGRMTRATVPGEHAYLALVAADGSAVSWSRTLEGSGSDLPAAVAVDAGNRVWVAGTTTSADLPISANAIQAAAGGRDAFVATYGEDGALLYASYFGGAGDDEAAGLAARQGGGVLLAGSTNSPGLATPNAAQAIAGGNRDGFVASIDATGTIAWASYLGGRADESLAGVAIDRGGRILLAGTVDGASTRPARTVGTGGGRDAFVTAIAGDGTRVEFTTRLGGSSNDEAAALAVDHAGHIVLAGRSPGGMPAIAGASHAAPLGDADAYHVTLSADGAQLLDSGIAGGAGTDDATAVAVDSNGRLWVAGTTTSPSLDGASASGTLPSGGYGFVSVIEDRPAPAVPTGVCPGTRNFDGGPAGTGTAWETAANWSGDTLPTATDDVCIDGAFTVIVGSGAQAAATLRVQNGAALRINAGTLTIGGTSEINGQMEINGGTLTGAGAITISGLLTWSSGTISGGPAAVTANGGIAFDSSVATLNGRALNSTSASPGAIVQTGTNGYLSMSNGATFNNAAGALFEVQNDNGVFNGGGTTSTFNNSGTFRRTTSSGLADIQSVTFNNNASGTVDVQTGTLQINGTTSANCGSSCGGAWKVATGAILSFNHSGTYTLSGPIGGAAGADGGGGVTFDAGTQTLTGTYQIAGETLIQGATVSFSNAGATTIDVLRMNGGTLQGSSAITVPGLFTWSSGTVTGGPAAFTAAGGIAFNSSTATLNGRTMNNTSASPGAVLQTGTGGTLNMSNGATFNNAAGALFEVQNDQGVFTGGGTTSIFNNNGTFRRTTASGVADIQNVTFNNNASGTVEVQTGTLQINGTTSANCGSSCGGAWKVATGAILSFNHSGTYTLSGPIGGAAGADGGGGVTFDAGTQTLTGTYQIAGETLIQGATVSFSNAGPTTIDVLRMNGGTLQGSSAITVPGLFTWSSGTVTGGPAAFTAAGGIAFNSSTATLNGRTMNNTSASPGAVLQTGTNGLLSMSNGATFNNATGALFEVQNDNGVFTGGGTTSIFNNNGTFRRTTASGVADIQNVTFNNNASGTVDVQTGTLQINGTTSANCGSSCGGAWKVATGAILSFNHSGTYTLSGPIGGAAAADGGGGVTFDAGTQTLTGTYQIAGETLIQGATVSFSNAGATTIDVLRMNGGTLQGSSAITVPGLFTWSSGTVTGGPAAFTAAGGIAFNSSAASLNGRTMNSTSASPGAIVQTGTNGYLSMSNGATFNNATGALFEVQNDNGVFTGGGTTSIFNNNGTFRRTTSSGLADIQNVTFNNNASGTVEVQTGTLQINGTTSANCGSSCGGAWKVATGTILSFNHSGTYTLSGPIGGAAGADGGGGVTFDGGTQTLTGTYQIAGETLVSGSTVNFSSASATTIDVLRMTGGTLQGSSGVSVPGLFTWSGGTVAGGPAAFNANGGIVWNSTTTTLNGRTMNSTSASPGAVVQTGTNGYLNMSNAATFNNAAGALFEVQNDNGVYNGGGTVSTFNNSGTFRRSTSSGVGQIQNINFNNTATGTVDVQTGTLQFSGTSNGTCGSTCGGAWKVASGAKTHFVFNGTYALSGPFGGPTGAEGGGDVNFNQGTVNLTGSYQIAGETLINGSATANFSSASPTTIPNLRIDNSGTLGGTGAVTSSGLLRWSSGTITGGPAPFTASGGIVFDSSVATLTGRTLNHSSASPGAVMQTGSFGYLQLTSAATFNNQAGALFEVQNDNGIFSGGGTASTFNNAGTFRRTTGTGVADFNAINVNNTGTVEVLSGALSVSGGGSYNQTAGVTRLNGGNVQDGTLSINGGSLQGTGTISNDVLVSNGGACAPGLSAGKFTIASDYTQTATGVYNVEIGGLTAGTQFDQVATGSTATVGGTLNVSLIDGFVPSVGNSFIIVDAGFSRSGNFSTTNFPPLSGGNVWQVIYTATQVILQVAPPTNADLAITKTDSPDPLNVGGNVTYTINVTNNGPDATTNVTVVDPLPASTTFVSATGTGWTCNNASGTVTCTRPNLAVGAAPAITIVATTGAGSDPSITNTATVSATEADLTPGNNSASATTTVNPVANLTITKTDTPDPVQAGGTITYTVGVNNAGPSDATSVVMSDPLPPGATYQSAAGTGWACFPNGNNTLVTCTRPTLAPGQAPDITIVVTAPSTPGSIINTVAVSSSTFDPVLPNNASATTNVTAVADLSITKGDSPDPVNAGATLTYTLNVSNAGPSTANTVSVTDTLPAGVTFVSATGTGWTCNQASGVVTCTRATLAVGAAPAITITVTAPSAGGSITNNASVTAAEFDSNAANNAANATTNVTPIADLSIAKTDSPDPANTSSTLTYTVTVSNAGPSVANNLTMTDTLPAGVTFVSATGTGWTCNQASGTVTCTRASAAVGAAPAITIVVTTPATPGVITNNASVAAETPVDPTPANNATTATTSVAVVTADMAITKTDTPDPVNAGGTLTYTVNVSNGGPDAATGVTMTDTLPAGVTFVSATGTGWTCNQASGTVTCTRATLAVGAAPAITITVTAPTAGGPITNTAVIAAAEADNNAANNTAAATTNVTAIANLTIAKTDSPDPVAAGGTLTYTIDVANAGPSTATTLSMVDTLPGGVTFQSATGTGWTCNNASGTVTCTRATLAVGAAPAITITVTAPGTPGSITNTATVTAAENDPSTPNTASATTNVTAVADLSITKGDSPDPVNAAATLTYTLNVSNAGPSAANTLSVTDTLPAGVTFVSATGTGWTCNQASGVVTCTRATLAVGAAPAITITVTAPSAGGSITNNASVTAAEFDSNAANNAASATTTVTPLANLSITKTDSPDPANTSSTLTYTVTVSNAGPSTANNLTMTDTLPAGVTFVSATGTGWTCNQASGTVTCTRATLAVGAAPAITIVVTTPATPGVITNNASVAAETPVDPTPANNATSATTSVAVVTADLSLTKTDSPDPVNAGATLTYTINVSNAGPDPANNLSMVDPLPAGVTFVSATGTGWTCNNAAGTVTCTRASLAVGAAPAITITVTAPAAGGAITNTAGVTGAEADNNLANNTASATTTVTPIADLSLTKSDSPDPVNAGAALTYTIAVSNAGPSTAAGVSVTDTLPTGTTFVSASGTGWTCNNASGTVTCTRATLAVGAAPAITIGVTAPANGGSISNTASVATTTTDPVSTNNSDTEATTVTGVNDLSIVKTASAATVATSANFSYTLAVSNAGPSQSGTVTVTDTLPAGVVYQSAAGSGWTCSRSGSTVTCTRPNLPVGAAPAITINVQAPNVAASPVNTATVAATGDPSSANNTSSAPVTVVASADLRVTKTANVATIADGSNLTYTISVRNAGASVASNVVVTDSLPWEVDLVSVSGSGWTCSAVSDNITCTRPSLGVATAPPITVVVNVDTGGESEGFCNAATAQSDAADAVPSNNTGTACVSVLQPGQCGSIQDLLNQVRQGGVAEPRATQLEAFLQTTLGMQSAGNRSALIQRLSLFIKQVRSAEAQGAMDGETADSLVLCAESLRQQLLIGVDRKKGASRF